MSGAGWEGRQRSAAYVEALRQWYKEVYAEEVAAEVVRLRLRRPLWHRLFPWKITVTRR